VRQLVREDRGGGLIVERDEFLVPQDRVALAVGPATEIARVRVVLLRLEP